MSLRKNFDSFTPQQKLRDAEEEYVQAVYRLRSAEKAYEQNVSDLKREMDFLFRRLGITGTASMQVSRWRSIWNIPQLLLIGVALSLLGSDLNARQVSNDVTRA